MDDSSQELPNPPAKKKRNLPGMPDPEAEVIALSPKTLLATNRFVCEICSKGFQRDQNLQLHRRGHNLPWKLRQRSSTDVKKRVYVCPELTCVHHNPARALGDLTGIKKHFCRKHGEKKWKCDRCSKKYAVQSDWKAHSKICGTREYKCDCGTLFSRRDSFITHRAFCDALAEESAKAEAIVAPCSPVEDKNDEAVVSSPLSSPSPPPEQASEPTVPTPPVQSSAFGSAVQEEISSPESLPATCTGSSGGGGNSSSNGSSSSKVFASLFASSTTSSWSLHPQPTGFAAMFRDIPQDVVIQSPSSLGEPVSLCLATSQASSMFGSTGQERRQYPQPALSATALLQKAAQMGASVSNASLLRGLELDGEHRQPGGASSLAAGLGLELSCNGGSGFKELMMGFGPKHTTLDLLGLGMAAGGGSPGSISALMTTIRGGNDDAVPPKGGGEYGGRDM
ncbi:zinc finger protein ENHYDROUS-like isoform X2 [Andrographis paniculata]|uniref:zinc finger protein ENHYDROUS-like isoform X2 n=1 Tax=Andrographis paniculata TaxID=175694 RepID=UPI0021E918AC|nr:zinc finger protein ENHYDROUS-like isoform X2 [Andrographis paniculata]